MFQYLETREAYSHVLWNLEDGLCLSAQVDGVGRVQLSKTVYNFTDMQDLRLVLGCKAHIDQKGKITPVRCQISACMLV